MAKTRLTEKEADLLQLLEAAGKGTSELSTYPGYMDAKRAKYLVISTYGYGGALTEKGKKKLASLKRPGWKWQKDSRGMWYFGVSAADDKSERARLRAALKDV